MKKLTRKQKANIQKWRDALTPDRFKKARGYFQSSADPTMCCVLGVALVVMDYEMPPSNHIGITQAQRAIAKWTGLPMYRINDIMKWNDATDWQDWRPQIEDLEAILAYD